jgi:hypothetical protein
MVGFRTPSHFNMVFRQALGITPGAYRAAALQEDRTAAQIADGPRDELFAGSCLAQDQDAGVCGGHDRDQIQGGLQGGAPPTMSPNSARASSSR